MLFMNAEGPNEGITSIASQVTRSIEVGMAMGVLVILSILGVLLWSKVLKPLMDSIVTVTKSIEATAHAGAETARSQLDTTRELKFVAMEIKLVSQSQSEHNRSLVEQITALRNIHQRFQDSLENVSPCKKE